MYGLPFFVVIAGDGGAFWCDKQVMVLSGAHMISWNGMERNIRGQVLMVGVHESVGASAPIEKSTHRHLSCKGDSPIFIFHFNLPDRRIVI